MLLIACVIWVVFAVRNPNSAAGQCLIQVFHSLAYVLTFLLTNGAKQLVCLVLCVKYVM